MPDLDKLRIFMAAAEYQNLSRAAESLYLNHTTVSRAVTALEEHFGCTLMHRSQKGALLTPAGKALYEQGRLLLDAERELESTVRAVAAGTRGDLRIVTQKLSCEAFFIACELFSKKYPEVRLNISGIGMHTAGLPLQMLQDGRADGAVVMVNEYMSPENPAALTSGQTELCQLITAQHTLSTLTIGQSEFCLLISARHPLAQQDSISLEELVALKMPVFRRERLLQMLKHLPPEDFFTLDMLYEKDLPEHINLEVRAGKMAAVLPRGLAEESSAGCKLLTITGADQSVMLNDIQFVWSPRSPNPSLNHFTDILRQVAETLTHFSDGTWEDE